MSVLPVGMGSSGVDVGDIGHSLRLRASASAYLSRTFGSISGNDKVTVSCWGKRTRQNSRDFILEADTSNRTYLAFEGAAGVSGDGLAFYVGGAAKINTTALFRDPSAWYHICLIFDGAAAGGTATIYVNNVSVGSATGIGTTIKFCQNVAHAIGRDSAGGVYADEYLSRFCVVSGSALTPSSFGYLNTDINEWVSKSQSQVLAVVEAGGTNSFMLDFDDATSLTTLGYDKSSKNNDWTLNNVSLTSGVTYDWMLDVPGNSYCTLSPIAPNATYAIGTLQAANLEKVATGSNNEVQGTMGVSSGKWYFEYSFATNATRVGIATGGPGKSAIGTKGVLYENSTGNKLVDGGSAAYGATFTSTDVIGVALDADTNQVTFYKNNTSQGAISFTPTDVISPSIFTPNGTTITAYFNAGQRPFAYTPPTGFKALCTANLPAVAITNPRKHFDVVTRAGTSAAATVSSLSMQPDFIWIKSRTLGAGGDHVLIDSVRGTGSAATKELYSDLTNAESGSTNVITAFSSNGYSLGTDASYLRFNATSNTYVDWLWKANGAGVNNTAGSITSTVSANTTAGFSIVAYTGTGANATVGHGLGVAPKFIIARSRTSAVSWIVKHSGLSDNSYYIALNSTGAQAVDSSMWQGVPADSTVFSIGSNANLNPSGGPSIAYCFAEIPGYSKIGSYVGNGSADGPFVYCGFRPKFVMWKKISGIAADWEIADTARSIDNPTNEPLYPNSSSAETTLTKLDITANGFKVRSTDTDTNVNGETYIFLAIADVAGKYSLAR